MDAKSECPVLYTENFFVQFEATWPSQPASGS
jgi:hypothetical protein